MHAMVRRDEAFLVHRRVSRGVAAVWPAQTYSPKLHTVSYTLLCVSSNSVSIETSGLQRFVFLAPFKSLLRAEQRTAPPALSLVVLRFPTDPRRLFSVCDPRSPSHVAFLSEIT
jgi:hypothetical protein